MPIHSPDKRALVAHVQANLKAYVALVGMIATALLEQHTGSTVLTTIATICTVFGVWSAPNTPNTPAE